MVTSWGEAPRVIKHHASNSSFLVVTSWGEAPRVIKHHLRKGLGVTIIMGRRPIITKAMGLRPIAVIMNVIWQGKLRAGGP